MRRRKVAPATDSDTTPSRGAQVQWASETGAHGMPIPQELERLGWHRLAEHPLLRGTWLMEAINDQQSTVRGSKLKVISDTRGPR